MNDDDDPLQTRKAMSLMIDAAENIVRSEQLGAVVARLHTAEELLREWQATPFFDDPNEWRIWRSSFAARVERLLLNQVVQSQGEQA